jgi:Collagen triple helix repeat (20 copies)
MKQRLPIVLSSTALMVAFFGSTSLGHAVVASVPAFAKQAGYANRAGNAIAVNGIKASKQPRPGMLVPLGLDGKLPASVVGQVSTAGPKGDPGEKGAKGDKGDKGDKGLKGDPGNKGRAGAGRAERLPDRNERPEHHRDALPLGHHLLPRRQEGDRRRRLRERRQRLRPVPDHKLAEIGRDRLVCRVDEVGGKRRRHRLRNLRERELVIRN